VAANESSAIAALRTITQAQFAYHSDCGRGSYATSLTVLGAKRGNRPGFLAEDLGLVAMPQHNGYRFNVHPGLDSVAGVEDCNKTPTQTRYYASAVPIALGRTGGRSFATSQANGIWQLAGGIPPAEPFGPPSQLAK
jgi:hypothetical protein